MKTTIVTAVCCLTIVLLGFNVNNHYTRKIASLEKQVEVLKKHAEPAVLGCSTVDVADKDLAAFMKANNQNPDLNAVLVRVGTVRQALEPYW